MSAVHPPETINSIAKLAESGMSASQIGAEMGLTRNVIVGLASRNSDKIQLHGKPAGGVPRKQAMAPKPAYMQCEAVAEEVLAELITFEQLTERTCRFPFGDRDYKFCGKPKFGELPYCGPHCQLAYHPRG